MQYDTPYFPVDFILNYIKNEKVQGLKRVQIYVAFRFFVALEQKMREAGEEKFLADLAAHSQENFQNEKSAETAEQLEAIWQKLEAYLEADLYFSPAFAENSFEPLLLLFAMEAVEEKDGVMASYMDLLLSRNCPEALRMSYDDAGFTLDFAYEKELLYWAALYICVTGYESLLEDILPEFARVYWNDLHFTCGDFLLYDFLNQYFEATDVLHDERFIELNQVLVLATLQSFNTDMENLTMDVMLQLKRPASYFAGLYQSGVIAIRDLPTVEIASKRMKKILEYATAYELRNNLYDFHLEEDRTITFTNWKEELKWHYVQYNKVYNMAFMTYYASEVSRHLLKKQLGENLCELSL